MIQRHLEKRKIEVDVSSSVLEDLVVFLKTPDLSINALELGFVSKEFHLPLLLHLLQSYLLSNITRENYHEVSSLASTFDLKDFTTAFSRVS